MYLSNETVEDDLWRPERASMLVWAAEAAAGEAKGNWRPGHWA